jgi:hypothetical protein
MISRRQNKTIIYQTLKNIFQATQSDILYEKKTIGQRNIMDDILYQYQALQNEIEMTMKNLHSLLQRLYWEPSWLNKNASTDVNYNDNTFAVRSSFVTSWKLRMEFWELGKTGLWEGYSFEF